MLALGSVAFLLFGFVLVLLGVCQPGITRSLGLDHTGFGLLGSALSAGIGTSVLVAGVLVDRYPRRPLFLASTLVTATALATVEADMSLARALVHVALVGAGCGIYDTLLNTVVVERWGAASVRPMSLLHAAVPVGAVLAPLAVHVLGGSREWVGVFRAASACYVLLSVWVAFVSFPSPAADRTPERRVRAGAFATPAFLALCAVAFAYIGIEAALTLFATPYAMEALALAETDGGRAISGFWLGIGLGRVLLLVPRGTVDARWLVGAGALGALLVAGGVAVELRSVDWWLGACGLAISTVFPIMIALGGQLVPTAPGKAVGLVAGLGSIGGFALPWLTGAIADAAGIALAFGSLAAWCAAIAIAAVVAQRSRAPAASVNVP